jgi:hypothetical protein
MADLSARTIEFDNPPGPKEIDAFDSRTRADHEAVPHSAGHGLRIKLRCA